MGTGFILEIPYTQMLFLVMALFMFVGATRGWSREFVTTCGLVVLLVLLIKPELAAPIISYFSKLIRLICAFIQGRGTVDLRQLMANYEAIQVPFDGKNPYAFLIIALVAFVFLSYATRDNGKNSTALGRLLGGLLGLLNGFLVISLVKEYMVKYLQQRTPILTAAGPPAQVSVAVKGLPIGGPLVGVGWESVAILLGSATVLALLSNATGLSLKPKKKEG